ncbi:MAG TPA: hypothetical protein VFQ45_07230 [Longimicrobium sp.]|nr:hypothetical protein [Longimicrobium sp.]
MFPPTHRLNYFDHQFLRVDDFTDEQAYHLGMRRAHNRLLHTPGVAQGLAVTHAGDTVTVGAGVALDGQGREVVLKEPVELALPDAPTAWVTVAYGERRIEPTTETGAAGDRRWEEVPAVRVETEPPDDPETRLVLARVTLAEGRVAGVDDGDAPAHRRVAGPAPGAELEVRSLDVSGSAAIRGSLSVGQTLSVGGARGGATLNLPGGRADGDLRVGTESNRLSVGVEVAGAAAGTARLRAEGAAPRLLLGSAGADVLTVQPGGVGIGTAPAAGVALTVEGALDATELRQNGAPVVSSQWSSVTGGIAYTGGRVGFGTTTPTHPYHFVGGPDIALFESTGGDAFIRLMSREGPENRVEFCNRPGGVAALWTAGAGDALRVQRDGRVHLAGPLSVGAAPAPGSTARLQVAGGSGDLEATEGDFTVGNDVHRLKVGVTTGRIGGGDVRIRAVGGTQTLMLGSGASDVLTVRPGGVGIGTAPAEGAALTVNGVLDATELRQNGVPVTSMQWSRIEGGIAYTDGRVGVGTNAPQVPLHVVGTRLRLENAGAGKHLDMRTDGTDLDLYATGGALFVHTGNSGKPLHLNAFGGNVGVGTVAAPTARLQVAGGNGDLGATEGDFAVGNDTYRLKMGVTTASIGGGDVRMRAVGGTQKLMLGSGANDVLTVTETAVGIGTTTPGYPFHLKGSTEAVALFASNKPTTYIGLENEKGADERVEFCNRGERAAIWLAGKDALNVYRTGEVKVPEKLTAGTLRVEGTAELTGNVGIGTASPSHPLHVKTAGGNVALFESTGKEAFVRLSAGLDFEKRVEFCNRGGFASIWVPKVGDALRVLDTGNVQVTGRLLDSKLRLEASRSNKVTLTNTNKEWWKWADIDGMSISFELPAAAKFLVRFQMGGVQVQDVNRGQAGFRFVDGDAPHAFTVAEFHNTLGWSLQVVALERILDLAAGSHTLKAQWFVASPDATAAISALAVGCHHGDIRTLIAIEL